MSEKLNMTDEQVEAKIAAGEAIVVDFWAPWCGPCKMIGPIIEELAGEYDGKVTFAKVNVDEQQKLAGTNGVTSIPTILFYKDGKRVDTLIGAVPKPMLEAKIKANFNL